jgi:replicative DNA helicase
MSDLPVSHDPEAERAVLAAAIQSTVARDEARRHLAAADFLDPRHEAIWTAITRLERAKRAVDMVTILAVLTDPRAKQVMPDLVTSVAQPDHVAHYAAIVRGWATRRRLWEAATLTAQQCMSAEVNPVGYAAATVTRFTAIRDSGATDDTTAETLAEILADPDDEPDWLIYGLLERGDRLMLTGLEGGGKSYLLRQIAIMTAGGLHPFDMARIAPLRCVVIDCENSRPKVKRKVRPIVGWTRRYGLDPADRVLVDCCPRMDITRDRDLARIHRLLDAAQPDLVVIGPLYRLVPRALQTDDEAGPVLAALDTIRDRGIALLIEAHAGHALGKGGLRDMRPRGSSALLGWPEFGYGLRADDTTGGEYAELTPWRGDRDERDWPTRLRRSPTDPRWIPADGFDTRGRIA